MKKTLFKKYLFLVLILFGVFFFAKSSLAANHYIRQGATGSNNGNDWTNAWTTLPSTLTRGDTYYIGDGTYGFYTFNDAVSGTTYIYIKKATVADHGQGGTPDGSVGWNDSYGDGQAIFTGQQRFETGHYVFDGNTSSGLTGIGTYGFKVAVPTTGYYIYLYNGPTYVTIKDTDIDARSNTQCISGGLDIKCIQGNGGPSYITAINDRCINFGDGFSTIGDYQVVEYCVLARATTGGEYEMDHNGEGECGDCENVVDEDGFCEDADHGDAIANASGADVGEYYTIRYNTFIWNGQIIYFYGTGTSVFENIYIYGNVFYVPSGKTPAASSAAVNSDSASNSVTNLYFYNNTLYHLYYSLHMRSTTETGQVRNNIIIDMVTYSFGDLTHEYNAADADLGESYDVLVDSSIFTNAIGYNFTLTSAGAASMMAGNSAIGSTYNTDMLGNIRGSDGKWDRGAYEYVGAAPPDTTPPAAPTGLSII